MINRTSMFLSVPQRWLPAATLLLVLPLISAAGWERSTPPGKTALNTTAVFGFSEPVQAIDLAASETGILDQLRVQPGDRVQQGQELGRLDSHVLMARLDIVAAQIEAQARLKAATIRVQRAESTYEKLQSLYEEGHGGSRELELAASDLELARTDLTAVEEETAISRLERKRISAELRRRQIISPIDGIVSEIHRDVGEFVAATAPDVLTIVNLKQLRIRFYPSADQAAEFHRGARVKVRFVHSQRIATARVDFVSPIIDADSNTIRVEVLLDNTAGEFRSGRRCVLLTDHSEEELPQAAVRPVRNGFGGGRL